MTSQIKYNCIFGGGGIRGMCYVGAIKALKELKIELGAIAGSSVGAVFASLLAVGYNEEEIKELFLDFNFNMFRDLNINLFNTDISLSKGEIFLDWLREKIGKKIFGEKYKNQKIRFKDIEKDLHILTLDINTNTPYIFSKENTPDEEIALAVRSSASLPGLMKPINLGDSMLVDGDLMKSWPAWKIYEELNTSKARLLEFRLEGSKEDREIKNPMAYLNSIISTIWFLCTENIFNSYFSNDRYDYVVIDTKETIIWDFTLDNKEKERLVEKGYKSTKDYFLKSLPKKKNIILKTYKNIYKNTKLLEEVINKNIADEAKNIINEILSTMYEDSKYIDISIYEKLKDLKECLVLNTKKKFMFTKIDNEKQIKERVEFITMLIEERITDITNYLKSFS